MQHWLQSIDFIHADLKLDLKLVLRFTNRIQHKLKLIKETDTGINQESGKVAIGDLLLHTPKAIIVIQEISVFET